MSAGVAASGSSLTSAVVVVPFRDRGDVQRRRNLKHVVAHLEAAELGPVIVIGDGRAGDAQFNRSSAYNNGVLAYPKADVWVFHEADMIVAAEQLRDGIDLASWQPGLVVPFTTYHYLSEVDSTAVCHGEIEPRLCQPEQIMRHGRSVGAVNCVSSESMAAVGRWDEHFEGWGFDDRAMAHAFTVATGHPVEFVPGPGFHLWHRPGWSAGVGFAGGVTDLDAAAKAATERNLNRYKRYLTATTPEKIRELTR